MIEWSTLPLWCFRRLDDRYVVKVRNTSVESGVQETQRDHNLKVEVYGTDNRSIGYVLRERHAGKRPLHLVRPLYLGLFYSDLRDLREINTLRSLTVLYYDANIRVLAFGQDPKVRDYMVVLRKQDRE